MWETPREKSRGGQDEKESISSFKLINIDNYRAQDSKAPSSRCPSGRRLDRGEGKELLSCLNKSERVAGKNWVSPKETDVSSVSVVLKIMPPPPGLDRGWGLIPN